MSKELADLRKKNLEKLDINAQFPEGPIISLKPGPTLANEAADPDKEVIKS